MGDGAGGGPALTVSSLLKAFISTHQVSFPLCF